MTTITASKWVRVNRRNPCPVCSKYDWCLIAQDGKAAICARIESDRPVGTKGAGWLHSLNGELPVITPKDNHPRERKQSADNLNAVYNALLSHLKLSAKHRENLLTRGLSNTAIDYFKYRTMPASGRAVIAHALNKEYNLVGIPGFWQDNGNPDIAGVAGLLIPVRDTHRRIIGCQIRADHPGTGGKYRWLSSPGYLKGTSSGAPVHVSRAKNITSIWITEGVFKSDIVAFRLHRTVLAVPGVGNWPGVIPILRELRPAKVIVAFDSDKKTNDVVRHHLNALITCLYRRYHTFEANWDSEHKGIDDLLAMGVVQNA